MAQKKHEAQADAAAATATATETTEQVVATPAVKTPEPKTQAMKLRNQANALEKSLEHLPESAQASLKQRITHLREEADVLSPKKSGSSSEPRPTCSATKADGTPCTAKAMQGKDVCTDHRPVLERFDAAEIAKLESVTVAQWIDLVGWGRAKKLAASIDGAIGA